LLIYPTCLTLLKKLQDTTYAIPVLSYQKRYQQLNKFDVYSLHVKLLSCLSYGIRTYYYLLKCGCYCLLIVVIDCYLFVAIYCLLFIIIVCYYCLLLLFAQMWEFGTHTPQISRPSFSISIKIPHSLLYKKISIYNIWRLLLLS